MKKINQQIKQIEKENKEILEKLNLFKKLKKQYNKNIKLLEQLEKEKIEKEFISRYNPVAIFNFENCQIGYIGVCNYKPHACFYVMGLKVPDGCDKYELCVTFRAQTIICVESIKHQRTFRSTFTKKGFDYNRCVSFIEEFCKQQNKILSLHSHKKLEEFFKKEDNYMKNFYQTAIKNQLKYYFE